MLRVKPYESTLVALEVIGVGLEVASGVAAAEVDAVEGVAAGGGSGDSCFGVTEGSGVEVGTTSVFVGVGEGCEGEISTGVVP